MSCIKKAFIHHASLAFFASAWADQCEDSDNAALLSGREIMDITPPDTDPSAIHAANTLFMDMERINQRSITELMRIVEELGRGDRENTIDYFAHYCAMQAMGHGVGLRDAFGGDVYAQIRVPHVEFGGHSLAMDYFA